MNRCMNCIMNRFCADKMAEECAINGFKFFEDKIANVDKHGMEIVPPTMKEE